MTALPRPSLRLRPTMLSDLDFVLGVERDAANRPFITPWERTQHEGAVRFPDFRHFIVEAGTGTQAAGFVILQGCRSPHRAVELKRIVLQAKGQGLGRACVRLLKQMAFRDLRAHRFWLDVKSRNLRAQHLYEGEGSVVAGALRTWSSDQNALFPFLETSGSLCGEFMGHTMVCGRAHMAARGKTSGGARFCRVTGVARQSRLPFAWLDGLSRTRSRAAPAMARPLESLGAIVTSRPESRSSIERRVTQRGSGWYRTGSGPADASPRIRNFGPAVKTSGRRRPRGSASARPVRGVRSEPRLDRTA